jgi:hypothetical protein
MNVINEDRLYQQNLLNGKGPSYIDRPFHKKNINYC